MTLVVCGYLGDRFGNRILIGTSGLVISIIGMSLIVGLPLTSNSGRLGGYYLTQASPTPFVAFLSLISSNVAGYTKKTTMAALYLSGYCIGNIIGKRTLRVQAARLRGPECFDFVVETGACSATVAFLRLALGSVQADRSRSRTAGFPASRQTPVRAGRDHHHSLLGRVPVRHVLHILLVPSAKREEGGNQGYAGVCEAGESGMVGLDGQGESRVCVHAVGLVIWKSIYSRVMIARFACGAERCRVSATLSSEAIVPVSKMSSQSSRIAEGGGLPSAGHNGNRYIDAAFEPPYPPSTVRLLDISRFQIPDARLP